MDYCTQQDIEDQFSPADVKKWADNANENDPTYIADRIARACTEGTTQLNDELRGGPYAVPFTTVPATITRLAATLAAVWLYRSRGIQDANDDSIAGRLSSHRREAMQIIRRILAGQMVLDATSTCSTVPASVITEQSDSLDSDEFFKAKPE